MVKKRGVRRLCIAVTRAGQVRVTMPRWVPFKIAEKFVRAQAAWIPQQVQVHCSLPRPTRAELHRCKVQARAFIYRKLKEFAPRYGVHYQKVTIRNQSSRWGSCSKAGNLNFNYRLIFLDESLVDYIVVHELCHLQEFNHSKRFWQLVAQTIPDHRQKRQELRSKKL